MARGLRCDARDDFGGDAGWLSRERRKILRPDAVSAAIDNLDVCVLRELGQAQ